VIPNMKRDFSKTAIDFWTNLTSLRTYADTLSPLASNFDQTQLQQGVQYLTHFFNDNLGISEENLLEISSSIQEISVSENFTQIEEVLTTKKLLNEKELEKKLQELDKGQVNDFFRNIAFSLNKRSNVEILHRSALISLVGFFEVLISEILHIYYTSKPQALSGDEKILSFNELINFKTIEDAVEQIISNKVDGFLRGSLDDWGAFFLKQLKIDLKELVSDWEGFFEIFQRRHVFVHSDGKVSKLYLMKVGARWKDKKLYESLDISSEYLDSAINYFLIAGLKLIYLCWGKLYTEEGDVRDSAFHTLIYELLSMSYWSEAEGLCSLALDKGNSTQSSRLVFQINKWLCIKRQGKLGIIKSELEKFDHLACHPKFSLCVYSLLENKDKFFEVLPVAINSGLSREDVKNWPVLAEMRQHDEYNEFIVEI
jgi:hypothetical protein